MSSNLIRDLARKMDLPYRTLLLASDALNVSKVRHKREVRDIEREAYSETLQRDDGPVLMLCLVAIERKAQGRG